MRNGDDDLIFDVCIDERLGKHTRVEGVRVIVEDQSAREYEYRVDRDRRFPPFNLDPRAGIPLKVIAKFEQKLPTSGEVVVVAEIPGRRDGRSAFQLPPPPSDT